MDVPDARAPATLEVVTYDPVARRGFMRFVTPAMEGRVVFHLSYLPRELRADLVARSRPLNGPATSPEDRRRLKADLRGALVGQRFRAVVELREDARWRLVVRSLASVSVDDA